MMAIREATRKDFKRYVPEQLGVFDPFLRVTPEPWIGFADEAFCCAWGLIPPTILSDNAYLWVYTNEALKGNEFYFIRQSQRWLKAMLEIYPSIYGHAHMDAAQSIRWIKLCGGVFEDFPVDELLRFRIRKP